MNGYKPKEQRIRTFFVLLIAMPLLICHASFAQVFEADLLNTDDGLSAIDPQTSLQWVNLTQTAGESLNTVLAGAGGWLGLGFRVATQAEVTTLLYRVGFTDIGTVSADHVSAVNSLFSLLGNSCFSSELTIAYGLMLDDTGMPAMTLAQRIGPSGSATASVEFVAPPPDFNFQDSCAGVYLVRDVSTDLDGDGVLNAQDNCVLVANPLQRDTNNDGFGNFCDPDIDNSGIVGFIDYSLLTSAFGTNTEPDFDFDGDGWVNFSDIFIYILYFVQPPGPSGLIGFQVGS